MTCVGFALGFALLTCTPSDPTTGEARFCQTARLFRYSRTDTPETRAQLRAHNAAYRQVCGDRK